MALALGLDTGGTYTDAVLLELSTQKVLAKAKFLTTYQDLTIGIRKCIEALNVADLESLKLVSLSTTLATNTIVEERGSKVGLLLIGEEPLGVLPVCSHTVVKGGHDLRGQPKDELDILTARRFIQNQKGKVDALAISGFLSVRNPEHELLLKSLVEEILAIPVVCGHQLTTSLGFHERTATAVLNARLIPVIDNLIKSVEKVLMDLSIKAQLMVVKGDGSLMSSELALEKPIETVLSGPAASIIGATVITKEKRALVIDIGGTTTDIAVLKDGIPMINKEGATVGGWLTRVEAADIRTFGIGGDSYIRLSKEGDLQIGPQKVRPLSELSAMYPYLIEELYQQRSKLVSIPRAAATDCYLFLRNPSNIQLTESEKSILEILASGPHTLLYLGNKLEKSPYRLDLERLLAAGFISRAALTPTDLLHAIGKFVRWETEASKIGVTILADLLKCSMQKLISYAMESITDKLCLAIIESLLNFEGAPISLQQDISKNYFLHKALKPKTDELFSISTAMNLPLIGIGAPVQAYLPQVSKKLNTTLIIPEHAEVANAIGAASGKVVERIQGIIKPSSEGGFIFHSQVERKEFMELEEAKAYANESLKLKAAKEANKAGTVDYQIDVTINDIYSNSKSGIYIETRIDVIVIGRPKW